jgi:hypothetical protein
MSQPSRQPLQPNASTLKIRDILVSNANRLAKDILNCSKSIDKYEKNLSENTVTQDLRIKFATIQLPKFISEDDKQSFLIADEELNQKFFQEKMTLRHSLFNKTLLKLEIEKKALLDPSNAEAYLSTIQSLLPGLPPTSMTLIDFSQLKQSVKDISNAQQIQQHQKRLLASPPKAQPQAPAQAMAVEEDRMAALEKQFKELQITLNKLRSSGNQPTPGPYQHHTKTRPIQNTTKRQHHEDRAKSTSPRRQRSFGLAPPPRPRSQSRERVSQERVRRGRDNQGRESQRPQQNRRGRSNESKHRF